MDLRDYDDPVELAAWIEWPQCPLCAQRRQARCPTCGLASDDFPLAEYQELGAEARSTAGSGGVRFADAELDEAILLMCPQCDEAFRPRFYDRCAACGYDYGSGLRIEPSEHDDLSARVLWAMAALTALLLAVFAYFWAVLRM